MQTRNWNFKADDRTRDINRWLTGLHAPGRYFGFDFSPTADLNLNLVHTSTGFKDVDHEAAESNFQSLVITRQGVVVKEDATLVIGAISAGDATHPRIDIVVMTHQIGEVAGGSQALYSIIEGTPAASPVAPALTNANTQVKIGELLIPAGTTKLNDAGVTWTQSPRPGFAGAAFTANRALVSNAQGVPVSSVITATELGHLTGLVQNVQGALNAKLSLAGGTMTGVLSMGSNKITNVAAGDSPSEAVNFAQLGTKINDNPQHGTYDFDTLIGAIQSMPGSANNAPAGSTIADGFLVFSITDKATGSNGNLVQVAIQYKGSSGGGAGTIYVRTFTFLGTWSSWAQI